VCGRTALNEIKILTRMSSSRGTKTKICSAIFKML